MLLIKGLTKYINHKRKVFYIINYTGSGEIKEGGGGKKKNKPYD